MLYFTSDLHFGHEGVLRHRELFSTVEEMDEVLIENWNKTVKRNDIVVITGDMFYRNKRPACEYLEILKGRKILVKGNHDSNWMKKYDDNLISRYFEFTGDMYTMKKNGEKLRFCHYPMISWDSSRYGSLLVCGHIHGKKTGMEAELFKSVPYAFNAGVDINGFSPVTIDKLIINNMKFYERKYNKEQLDHLEKIIKVYGEYESVSFDF